MPSCFLDKAKSRQPVEACVVGVGRPVLQPLPCSSMSDVYNQTGSGPGSGQGKEKGLWHNTAPSQLGIVLCSFLKTLFSAEPSAVTCHASCYAGSGGVTFNRGGAVLHVLLKLIEILSPDSVITQG